MAMMPSAIITEKPSDHSVRMDVVNRRHREYGECHIRYDYESLCWVVINRSGARTMSDCEFTSGEWEVV